MRRGPIIGIVMVAAMSIAIGCGRRSQDYDLSRAEITTASREFSAAYVRGDTAAIGNLYSDDAYLLPPGRVLRGRDAITGYFAPIPNRTIIAHQMKSDTLTIDGGMAVDVGIWSSSWQRVGDTVQSASDRYLVVWRRGSDGKWRMEYDMWHRPSN